MGKRHNEAETGSSEDSFNEGTTTHTRTKHVPIKTDDLVTIRNKMVEINDILIPSGDSELAKFLRLHKETVYKRVTVELIKRGEIKV